MKILRLILFLLFITFAFQAQAQLSLGLKGGYTIAWPSYDLAVPDGAKTDVRGKHFSTEAYWRFNKYFSLGLEPGYVERGAACAPGWQPIFRGDTRLYLNSLNLPIIVKFDIPLVEDKFSIYLRAGYEFSYLIAAYEQVLLFDLEDPLAKKKMDLDEYPRMNRDAHGAHFGFGADYKMGKSSIFVESDLYLAVSNIESQWRSEQRNINFSAGYRYTLGDKN